MNNYKKFKIITLGCKVNQAESLEFARDFLSAGYKEAEKNEKPDYVLINTCCVTGIAERKSRKFIRRAIKNFPSSSIWVTGCLVNLNKDIKEKITGISKVFTNEEKQKISEAIRTSSKKIFFKKKFSSSPRALLKIADGCNEHCSYCIVPFVRGPVKSRAIDEILNKAKSLVETGKKELVLTAINLGLYGVDFKNNENNLKNLIKKISEISGLERIRLSSLEPMYFTDELIEFLMTTPKICPHFYIPLQSGSSKILRLMGRRYQPEDFLKIMEKIRSYNIDVSINTDVIVGFPGEEEADFQESYNFIKSAGFSRLHIFPYSKRPGTIASKLPFQVNSKEIKKRVKKMLELRSQIMHQFHKRFTGKIVEVLVEEFNKKTGFYEGLTENYLRVLFKSSQNLVGQFVKVKITSPSVDFLKGEIKIS